MSAILLTHPSTPTSFLYWFGCFTTSPHVVNLVGYLIQQCITVQRWYMFLQQLEGLFSHMLFWDICWNNWCCCLPWKLSHIELERGSGYIKKAMDAVTQSSPLSMLPHSFGFVVLGISINIQKTWPESFTDIDTPAVLNNFNRSSIGVMTGLCGVLCLYCGSVFCGGAWWGWVWCQIIVASSSGDWFLSGSQQFICKKLS